MKGYKESSERLTYDKVVEAHNERTCFFANPI